MKKRVISALMVFAVVMQILLAGCGKADVPKAEAPKAETKQEAKTEAKAEPVTIDFTYWASAGAESEAFDGLVQQFEEKNPGIKVNKQGGDFKDFYTKLETRIAANNAPDATRIQYQQIGRYSSNGVLLDITQKLPADYGKDFIPSVWKAVSYKNAIYALPQHTDTLAVFYNKDYFEKLGIKAPDKLEDAWTWNQFLDIAKQLKEKAGAKYGFSFNWTKSNSYRWLPLLYQKGGALLTDDLSKSAINSPEALETLKMTQSFVKDNLIPAGTSVKGTEDINNLFSTGTTGMVITGNWMASNFEKNMKNYKFGATYMPKDKEAASDMGGNALGILKKAKNPEAALTFVQYMVSEESMKTFVEKGFFLPVRKTLTADKLNYSADPQLMKVFVDQATTIPEDMAQAVTSPAMSKINQVLTEELEQLLTQGKAPEAVMKSLDEGINKALKE